MDKTQFPGNLQPAIHGMLHYDYIIHILIVIAIHQG